MLLQGTVREDGLYCFTDFHLQKSGVHFNFSYNNHIVVPSCFSIQKDNCNPSYTLWHSRLEHPHSVVVQSVLKSCNLKCGNKSYFCNSCPQKLPSYPSQTVYTTPLELLFMYVWGTLPSKMQIWFFLLLKHCRCLFKVHLDISYSKEVRCF